MCMFKNDEIHVGIILLHLGMFINDEIGMFALKCLRYFTRVLYMK